jgi:hypothetical protein
MRRLVLGSMIALAGVTPLGCQVLVASLTVPLDSAAGTARAVGGSLEGILNSSGLGTNTALMEEYKRDLRQYAALYMQSGGDGTVQDFQRGVSRIAESHGIAHWEAEPATPYAIGQGMREANVSEAAMREFCEVLGSDTLAARLALEGWRAGGT